MRRINLLIVLVLLFSLCSSIVLFAQEGEKSVNVSIRVVEEDTREITPVMVCITSVDDGKVRIPPLGEILKRPSGENLFYKGIEFDSDKNWIGPVRKMNGLGNNGDRSFVYGLLPSLPYWSDQVAYQTSGDFTIKLLPGKWHISIGHGNEFIPIHEEFTLSDKKKEIKKEFVLKRWIHLPQRGWYSGDVHVHHPSETPGQKAFLLEYAKAEDVHLVNLLEMGDEHDTYFKQEGFGQKFRVTKGDICLVGGQEDPRSKYGHIVGLNINGLARDTAQYNYYDVVFKKLHEQPGALAGFSHFSWNGNGVPLGFPMFIRPNEIDFVELLQFAHINTSDYHDYLNLGLRLTAAAGSDLPWGSTLGEVRTFVYTGNDFSADAWFAGLKSGHSFVSNGPALFLEIDGKIPGTEIKKSLGDKSELKVKAISNPGIGNINHVAIYHNSGILMETMNPEKQDSLEINISLTLEKSQWIAAAVYCDNGAVAHTTPIYVIVDGHPTWDAETAPSIICTNLGAIKLMEDMEKSSLFLDPGILLRLEIARNFYNNLLIKISEDH